MDRIYMNNDWLFHEQFQDSDIDTWMTDGVQVRIPHTVRETPFNYFDEQTYQMVSCYQHEIFADPAWAGKQIFLTLEGAAHEAKVFLNGDYLGTHRSGYTAYTVELTDHLKTGEKNLLSVRLDSRESLNQPPFGFVIDYMTYGGIYRDVYLEIKEPAHMTDVFYQPEIPEVNTEGLTAAEIGNIHVYAQLHSRIQLSKEAAKAMEEGRVQVNQYVKFLEQGGQSWKKITAEMTTEKKAATSLGRSKTAASVLRSVKQTVISSEKADDRLFWQSHVLNIHHPKLTQVLGEKNTYACTAYVPEAYLWDIDSPVLYEVKTELLVDGKVNDTFTAKVGFRAALWQSDGFYLNGRKVKIHGLNRHQSYAYVGYAMPESMQREDARILKNELGVNTVRTSHYPQSHYFIDECDRLGLLVVTEFPGWQHIGDEQWKQIALRNVWEMVTQYRNHPSIILWGVRINESKDNDELYAKTNALCRYLDSTRATCGVRCMMAGKDTKFQEDVFTYNDFVHSGKNQGCTKKAKVTAGNDTPYLVTEYNGHMFPTKSYDCEEHRVDHMLRHANVMDAVYGEADIAGCIGWCMFDYNTHKDFGSGDRICYHGVMDMFRNPKLAAFVHAAQGRDDLVLQVSSTMDIGEHPGCNRGDIYIITNADAVRMYKNGKLLKQYTPADSAWKQIPYGPVQTDDYIGSAVAEGENYSAREAKLVKDALNNYSLNNGKINAKVLKSALPLALFHGFKLGDMVPLYQKYIGDWGGESKEYTFKAVKWSEPDRHGICERKMIRKRPVTSVHLKTDVSSYVLEEKNTYDVACIRIQAVDQDGNVLPYCQEALHVKAEGTAVELIGPEIVTLKGGMTGVYVKTTGVSGKAKVTISNPELGTKVIQFESRLDSQQI